MAGNGALTAKQRRFIAALCTTSTIRAAAQACGIGERTCWRWMRQPAVKAEVRARQDSMLAQVPAGLAVDMGQAREALRAVLSDKTATPSQRTTAAGKLLDAGLRLFELVTLSDRVAVLEARASEREPIQ